MAATPHISMLPCNKHLPTQLRGHLSLCPVPRISCTRAHPPQHFAAAWWEACTALGPAGGPQATDPVSLSLSLMSRQDSDDHAAPFLPDIAVQLHGAVSWQGS